MPVDKSGAWLFNPQGGYLHMEEKMLNHVSIGVRDINRAKRFYDAALQPLGYR